MVDTRPGRRAARRTFVGAAHGAAAALLFAGCGGDPPVGPDALRPERFELVGVGAGALPAYAYTLPLGGTVWLKSAELKSVEPGRSIDPRLFEDRSGGNGSGGGGRDSTTASARMADVRVFEERSGGANTPIVQTRRDSSGVIVERHGDLLLIKREHPDPLRAVVDTGEYSAGYMVVTVREWERFSSTAPMLRLRFSYVVRSQ